MKVRFQQYGLMLALSAVSLFLVVAIANVFALIHSPLVGPAVVDRANHFAGLAAGPVALLLIAVLHPKDRDAR